MKKSLIIACCIMLAIMSVLMVACGDDPQQGGTDNDTLQQFSGVKFDNKTVTYNGQAHTLQVSGTLPEGTDVKYSNNVATDAGTYNATATLTKDGYKTTTLQAVLTIEKADFVGLSLESAKYIQTGKTYSLEVKGELPTGTTVEYTNNNQSKAGTYEVVATITNKNYNTLTLKATLTINKLQDAISIVNSVLVEPDIWQYLPTVMHPENIAYNAMPVTDFSSNVNVSNIGTKQIGLQLNVVYDLMFGVQSGVTASQVVFDVAQTIADAYQHFINTNPEGYADFEGSVDIGGTTLSVKIQLSDSQYMLLAGNQTINLELYYDIETETRTGRIQVTDGVVLKFQSSENTLRLAVEMTVGGIGYTRQVIFERDNLGNVVGHLYEFKGAGETGIKTSALVYSNSKYTYIIANKRQSDDMPIDAYQEVYSSTTGNYLGGEVQENLATTFDTLWFALDDVTGIETIKVGTDSKDNYLFYVNGSSSEFVETKNNFGLGSRRYDIELKKVFYMVKVVGDNGEVTYERQEANIPMIFVQKENTDTFTKDVSSKNDGLTLSLPTYQYITTYFEENMQAYQALKEVVTQQEVLDFIGEKHEFFNPTNA